MSMPITRRMQTSLSLSTMGAAGDTTTTDSRSRRNRASSQRRPATNTSSQLNVRIGLPAPSCSRCLRPGWSHHTLQSWKLQRNLGTAHLIPVTNAIERLHEEFKRRIKTQTVLPSAETAAMLFWALLASGQITMRKVDGRQTLATQPIAQPIDLAA